MILIFSYILLLLVQNSICQTPHACAQPSNNDFCFEENYDPTSPPPDIPLKVGLPIILMEIAQVDDVSLTMVIDFYVFMEWKDTRIRYTKPNSTKELTLSTSMINDIFTPDLYIYQMISFQQRSVLNTVQGLYFYPDSTINLYFEGSLQMKCLMDFDNYPFDSQVCRVMIGSASYSDDLVSFYGSLTYKQDLQRTIQYTIQMKDMPKNECTLMSGSGNYSVYGFDIFLHRVRSPYIWQFYIPSLMFYLITLIAYVIPLDSGERGSVLVTLLLVFASMFIALNSTSPKANSLTALELWMVACIFVAFLSVVEFGVVLTVEFHEKTIIFESKEKTKPVSMDAWQEKENVGKKKISLSEKIDRISMIISIACFLIFNIWYWATYV